AMRTALKPAAAASRATSARVAHAAAAAVSAVRLAPSSACLVRTAGVDAMAASRGLGEVQLEAMNFGERTDGLLGFLLREFGEGRPEFCPERVLAVVRQQRLEHRDHRILLDRHA